MAVFPGPQHKTFTQLLDQRIIKYAEQMQPPRGVIQPISIPYIVHGGDSLAASTTTTTTTTTTNPDSQLLPLNVGPLPPFLIDFPFQITGVVLASPNSTEVPNPDTGGTTITVGGQVTVDIGTASIVPTTLANGYQMAVFPFFFSATGAAATFTETTDPATGIITSSFVVNPGPNTPALNGAIATIPDPYIPDPTAAPTATSTVPADWITTFPAFTWIQYSILAVDGIMTDLIIHLRVLQLGRSA